MPRYDGRPELTWTNEPLRLLAHDDGSYEWVSPTDYRVAEVRLLHDVASVGSTAGTIRAADCLLIHGDALNALLSLARLPEFAREYLGKVKPGYIDWLLDEIGRKIGDPLGHIYACLDHVLPADRWPRFTKVPVRREPFRRERHELVHSDHPHGGVANAGPPDVRRAGRLEGRHLLLGDQRGDGRAVELGRGAAPDTTKELLLVAYEIRQREDTLSC